MCASKGRGTGDCVMRIENSTVLINPQSAIQNPQCLLMLLSAEAFDGAAQDYDRFFKLGGGDELARAVRDAYVAGAEDDRLRAQLGQLRRFRRERDSARTLPRQLFERAHEQRVLGRFDAAVQTRDAHGAVEALVLRAKGFYFARDQ